ncbi:hypothetical protein ACVR05_06625 [Streptococcus caprae]|uniref:Uncharacterized protein n=1 Tax=Streptococcus caprae TaxID=1640501 RepID=A0ABV8CVZ7_9STRE
MKKRYKVYIVLLLLLLVVKFAISYYTDQRFTWWTTIGIGIGGILSYELFNYYLNK